MLVYGRNVAERILKDEKNLKKVRKIYVEKNYYEKNEILSSENLKSRIRFMSKLELDNLIDGVHQGIIIDMEDYQYTPLNKIIEKEYDKVLILDHILDPHNFGAIIRTAVAAGFNAIIIPNDRQVLINSTVVKTSVGAVFDIDIVDDEKPLIWLSGSYSAKTGSDLNLENEIFCADNYDNNPTCKIEGEYDLNTAGTYNLTYVAIDSSNNETRQDFTLNIYDPAPIEAKEEQPQKEQKEAEPAVTAFNDIVNTHKEKNTEIGIDVSKWQGDINFKKVKEAGATFVMIRVGLQQGVQGEYILDPYFKKNIEKAIENNLKVGVYFYSYADSKKEAEHQANWVLKQIKDYEVVLPIAFDWECYNNFNEMELSLFGLNEVAETFLDRIEEKGYDGMLYGSKNYLNSIWKYHEYDVWLAHYTNETDYDSEYVMWQLCQDGQIDGINTPVDINVLYKNKED